MKLNLGCGGKKIAGCVNVDCYKEANPDVLLNIAAESWPWPDSSVDVVLAWHILEHIDRADEFFHVIKEAYRVLKPGGQLSIIVPHPRHDVFLNDPTHCRAITPDGMLTFSKKHAERLIAAGVKGVTTYAPYLSVDFDLQTPVQKVLDPRIDPARTDIDEIERRDNNVVLEYRFAMTAVK